MKKFTDLRESNRGSVSVDTKHYDWGKMMTVHHGSSVSYPLHPEHQEAISKLKPGEKTHFKDETGNQVHAHRVDNEVHLHRPNHSNTPTKVPYRHFDKGVKEEIEQVDEAQMSHKEIQHAVQLHSMLKNDTPGMSAGHGYRLKSAHMSMIKKHGTNWRKKAGIVDAGTTPNSIYKEDIDEGIMDTVKAVGKKVIKKLGHGSDADMIKDLAKKMRPVNELNKSTLASYAKKAKGEMGLSAMSAGAQGARGELQGKNYDMAHAKKRSKGIDNAIDRLASMREAHLENDRANKHLHHATSPNANHKGISTPSSIDKHAKELNKVAGHGNKETMFNKAMGEEVKTSKAKSIMALAKAGKSFVKVHNPTNDKVNENSLHADFVKMMQDKGIKHRVHGTPEQEKQRTAEKLASNKAKVDASPKKPSSTGTFGTTRGYGQGRYMGD